MPDAERDGRVEAVLLDVDGTLVDTNYLHTLAWQRALREAGIVVPACRLHRHVGMGGDRYVAAVAGDAVEERCGDAVRNAHERAYAELMPEVTVLPGAVELVHALKERGAAVVLASSGKAHEIDHYLDLLGVRGVVDGWTTSADVDTTKPAPDLLEAALAKVPGRAALLVGDSVWDCEAAARAEIAVLGVLTGGFAAQELRAAGARAVYASAAALCAELGALGLQPARR
jgi:beta-phosphoglucomutase-like phosphatase (HAD superfamily)